MAERSERLSVPSDTSATQARVIKPDVHAWVSANAGSGKTYVLSRRVLRLLLDGAQPQSILCLTYTKAAASEMRHRVTGILAGWTRADAETLERALTELLARPPRADERLRAKSLFAMALDTPGGLKINTIHAFCESVLQRFPREAGVPVNFAVIEEQAAALLLKQARESVLAQGLTEPGPVGDGVRALFDALSDHQIETALAQCLASARALGPVLADPEGAIAAMRAHLKIAPGDDLERFEARVLDGMIVPVADWKEIFSICPPGDGTTKFEDKLGRLDPANFSSDGLFSAYLTGDGTVPAKFPKSDFVKGDPGLAERLLAEANRLAGLLDEKRALVIADNSAALTRVLAAIIARYEAQKRARSLMDFDDLVARTAKLLADRELGPWVRYKLDAGIAHILVDESQDTNPEQWAVVDALIDDFFSGEGAAGTTKTVFAVGDPKQSIYSFQGAEPRLFVDKGRSLARLADAAGHVWHGDSLRTSFRTLREILDGVDKVFAADPMASGLLSAPGDIRHESARTLEGGMVEIWPPMENPDIEAAGETWPTAPIEAMASAQRQLATKIADAIAHWIETGRALGPRGRAIRPEDILILVQKRQGIFPELVRALKQRNIASPGSDRLPVSAHIAVDDLLGLADVLTNTEDDLTLAAILRSPLFALSEEQLFDLAHDRAKGERLWTRLGASQIPVAQAAFAELSAWQTRIDSDRPYEFFAHVLYAQGGLKRFHDRLGTEVDEVIAEFLDLALAHETAEQPSLTGFLAAMRASDIVIKRDLAANAGGVRIMTVHGAKGLEAPIVILADAATKPRPVSDSVYFAGDGEAPFILYSPSSKALSRSAQPLRDALDERSRAEYWRNLYVAMTRAEDALYVAGVKADRTKIEETWHGAIANGLAEEAETLVDDDGNPTALRFPAGWVEPMALGMAAGESGLAQPLTLPVLTRKRAIETLAPSRSGKAFSGTDSLAPSVETLLDATSARVQGIALHALLEHMGHVPGPMREAVGQSAALTLLPDHPQLAPQIAQRAAQILAAPEFAHVFGPQSRAEVPFSIAARRAGRDLRIEGRIDRLVVSEKRVLIVDFKSDAVVPADAWAVPPGYRDQLGLYARACEALFPDHTIEAAILWTSAPALMAVPASLWAEGNADVTLA